MQWGGTEWREVALISFIARARSVIKIPANPPKTNINLVGLEPGTNRNKNRNPGHILISGLCPCSHPYLMLIRHSLCSTLHCPILTLDSTWPPNTDAKFKIINDLFWPGQNLMKDVIFPCPALANKYEHRNGAENIMNAVWGWGLIYLWVKWKQLAD